MSDIPTTGPERGEALRQILRRHDLTVREFAGLANCGEQTVQMLLNGGRTPLGRDLATRTTRDLARRISAAIAQLEPEWTSEDLWRVLGIPSEGRDQWRLMDGSGSTGTPNSAATPQGRQKPVPRDDTYRVRGTIGVVTCPGPAELTVNDGDEGLQVWRFGYHALLMQPQEAWQSRGAGVYLGRLGTMEVLAPEDAPSAGN